ncbi:MAG TPA: NnrS family protein [Nitrosomonas sp.]|nr:NnrS family protein [Nitrosomonas sp.]
MNQSLSIWNHLAAAPHRGLFLVGAVQGVFTLLWWVLVLLGRYGFLQITTEWAIAPSWAHAYLMVYGFFPFFIFGFLFTTFPNWMNGEKIKPSQYLSTCIFMLIGVILFYSGLFWGISFVLIGIGAMLIGWGVAIVALLTVLFQTKAQDKRHASVASIAFIFGWLGIASYFLWLLTNDVIYLNFARQAGIWFFLLPILLVVSHRMIPFFSSRVLENYVMVRPYWILWVMLACSLGHGLLLLFNQPELTWVVDFVLASCAFYLSIVWGFKRSFSVSLLAVLHISFAWLSIAMLLFALQSLMFWFDNERMMLLGLAPVHALVIGYFSSMVLGMASRVTLGHSGRPLALDSFTWLLFLGFQWATFSRILPDMIPNLSEQYLYWYLVAGSIWLVCFTIWAFRFAPIYWRPRSDGKPG